MRKKIFEITELAECDNKWSRVYDVFMMATIILSIIPLAFKEKTVTFTYIDYVTAGIFIFDYLLRFSTADYKLKKGPWSFLIYPFTPMAIIDLVSILPTFISLSEAFRVLKVVRLLRTFRVLRAFKLIRYSKSVRIINAVLKKQAKSLETVVLFAFGYIIISALVIFNVEQDTFNTFFEAIYWATVSLTTVGYGDIYPLTEAGRLVAMISSIIGIAIIALPSGIITAGFMLELNKLEKTAPEDEPSGKETEQSEEKETEQSEEKETEQQEEKEVA